MIFGKKLGCRRDVSDHRDHLMRAYLPVIRLPASVDYRAKMSPVRDQGDEGTCVGFASAVGMKEYQECLDYGTIIELSPRFLYAQCKKIDGMPHAEGTSIRVAMKVLKTLGVCREKFWPYVPQRSARPVAGAATDAKKFRTLSYARILNLDELRMNLAAKGPCVIGIQVFRGMMAAKTGVVPLPATGERSLGGHAICPVGYNDAKEHIIFKNSWSSAWGDKGYGYLSYAYIEKFMMDAWSTIDIEDPHPLTLSHIAPYLKNKHL